ncbi:PrsW family intramembrane metalloprotease [Streptococcus pyogenes]|uniref:PrsW family intramembrane metalloprotease n=1 Tax=Streptococcus pyogenes TaxID=1314 RepID=UPI0007C6B762|nr:PrsW family intramembrane metalloprotease [Streptococcus pyogenes]OAF86800.1 hypothetical protein AXK26_04980 [Streptococcus pyogenes]
MKQITQQKWLRYGLFIALVLNGIELELLGLTANNLSFKEAFALILTISLLGIYLIPFAAAIFYLSKKFHMNLNVIIVGCLSGLYISGFLASCGNHLVGQFWSYIIPSKDALKLWGDALTAPIVEEPIKASSAILVITLFPRLTLKEKLVVALLSGMGFQLTEDIRYLIQAKSIDSLVPTAIERISTAVTSHWVHTAIFTIGAYLLLKGSNLFSKQQQIFWLLSPLVLHFIWNSPLTSIPGMTVLLGTLILLIFGDLFQKINTLDDDVLF